MNAERKNSVVHASARPLQYRTNGEPCWRCNVRADVGCKHRAAVGDKPSSLKAQEQDAKRRRYNEHGGLSFHKDVIASNLDRAGDLLGLKVRRDG